MSDNIEVPDANGISGKGNAVALEREKKYFNEIRESLMATHADHFAVIQGAVLIGLYPNMEEAYSEAARKLGLTSVLIKKVSEQEQLVNIPALALGILSANYKHPTSR
jgi:hypothetical protein